jgi:hypothetical protein
MFDSVFDMFVTVIRGLRVKNFHPAGQWLSVVGRRLSGETKIGPLSRPD